jgi:DNA-binding PadR family transcriptional regulator
MFGRGDLKYALLDLLQERPKHGYEMIKELESRAGGFYTPSAGAVYPTLQLLEDREWVTAQTVEGKKVYSITDAGRQALQEHQARARERGERGERGEQRGPWNWGWSWGEPEREHGHGHRREHLREWGGRARPELRALAHEGREVARLMKAAVFASGGDPERLAQLRGIVERARTELQAFLNQSGTGSHGPQPSSPSGSDQPVGPGPVEQV